MTSTGSAAKQALAAERSYLELLVSGRVSVPVMDRSILLTPLSGKIHTGHGEFLARWADLGDHPVPSRSVAGLLLGNTSNAIR